MGATNDIFDAECVVVGAGIIGLAVARRLACAGREVIVLERAGQVGTHTSSRSNEVIHAGIYYRPGSPQATLCTRGREALYGYCESRSIAYRQLGKLVIATDEASVPWLEEMRARGELNGVPGLRLLTATQAKALEPELRCSAALLSPVTGIVDSHALMLAFSADAQAAGAIIAVTNAFESAHCEGGRFRVQSVSATGERAQIRCRFLVNAAGLWAAEVARGVDAMPIERVPKIYFAKGAFFSLAGRSAPFNHLIVPEPRSWRQGGIFTLDLAMRGRFGPDEQWVDDVDYGLQDWPIDHVYDTVRRYLPALRPGALALDYAGIRPRLNGPGMPPADWLFQGEAEHGIEGLVNLFGFESPGITASLPIADTVFAMLHHEAVAFAQSA
ncbi:MAG TPA: NAD(P)/FAD-dependent oxidoreductase [Casimicrobiaceae bacterium]|nr:NAD(P)/FAD-dependent oxidoreductase [Casimicrobiaceae bacterium]